MQRNRTTDTGYVNLAAVGNDDEGHQRRNQRDGGRGDVKPLVGFGRNDVFFEDHLDAVGERLQQAPRADAVRADAQLNPAHHLAFEKSQVSNGSDQNEENDRGFDYPLKKNVCSHKQIGGSTSSSNGRDVSRSSTVPLQYAL